MKKSILILIILLTPFKAYSADKWTATDKTLQTVYTAFHILDWKQTRVFTQQKAEYHMSRDKDGILLLNKHELEETNHYLGKNPTLDKVNAYFFTTLILHTTITHFLPQEYRKYWQLITIEVERGYVKHNFKMGIKISF